MEKKIDLTVLCLSYNHSLYIKQCLDGFVMQQTTYNIEVVVHDDASTDDTAKIVMEYAQQYPDLIIPLIEKENQYYKKNGIWNNIVPYLRGKYIAFCEGDDYWIDPNKIQRQIDFLESHSDYSMCFHNAFVLKSKKNAIGSRLFNNYITDSDLTAHDALFNWVVPTASIITRRDSILPTQKWAEDFPLADISIIFQSLVGGKVRYLNFVGSVYRQVLAGGSSASANFLSKNYYDNNTRIVSALSELPGELGETAAKRVDYLKKEHRFMKYYKQSKVKCLLLMPCYLIKRGHHRINKIKSICWLY